MLGWVGSILGRFCRVGRGSSMDFSSYTKLDCAVALQLQCCSFTSHRFLNPVALILSDFTILFISEITFVCNDFVAFSFLIVLIEILHRTYLLM